MFRIGAVKLKGVLGKVNAQYANGHVDLPSKVKVLHQKDQSEGPRRTSGVGYINCESMRIATQNNGELQ
jgi:hypothetical protein